MPEIPLQSIFSNNQQRHMPNQKDDPGLRSHNGIENEHADLVILLNSIPALVAYIDCNMVLQFCNQPFKTWFNINEEVTGQMFPQLTGPEIFHAGRGRIGHAYLQRPYKNDYRCGERQDRYFIQTC